MKTDAEDFTYRMFGWNKPVETIEFDGRFPVCDLKYIDKEFPCDVTLRAVAPFVPHNSDISSTPGFYLDFTIENPTENEIDVSLLGTLAPTFADNEKGRVKVVKNYTNYPKKSSKAPSTDDDTSSDDSSSKNNSSLNNSSGNSSVEN